MRLEYGRVNEVEVGRGLVHDDLVGVVLLGVDGDDEVVDVARVELNGLVVAGDGQSGQERQLLLQLADLLDEHEVAQLALGLLRVVFECVERLARRVLAIADRRRRIVLATVDVLAIRLHLRLRFA